MDQLKHIFNEHYAGLVDFARWYTKDVSAAEDVVQQVFIGIWQKGQDHFDQANIKFYLYRSVKNRCLNYIRDAGRSAEEELNDFAPADPQPDALEIMQHNELRKSIDAWIDELPPACKRVFILSRKEEMSRKEISELLGISVKTVENQITKALKYLRIKINEERHRG